MAVVRSCVLLLLAMSAGFVPQRSTQRAQSERQRQVGESCTTGQDLIVQALERVRADSQISVVEDANQLLRRANDLCAESGQAWYYRSVLEARLNHKLKADYAMRQALLFPSDALRDQLNPFLLSTPLPGQRRAAPPIRERWALIVGISAFADQRIPKLNYTAADANAFRNVLIDPKYGGFKAENVHLLVNDGATLKSIKKELNWLARSATPEDLVVVYIASHGSPRKFDTAGANYIITHDTELDPDHVDADSLYASALPMVDLANDVATRFKSLRTAVFLDTCYSGGAVKQRANEAQSVFAHAAVSKATLAQLSQGTGRMILTAAQSDQQSWESKELGHGYFTYFLVEALKEHPGMPLSEIFAAVQARVSQRVDKDYALYDEHQTPVLSQSADDADFALGNGAGVALTAKLTGMLR